MPLILIAIVGYFVFKGLTTVATVNQVLLIWGLASVAIAGFIGFFVGGFNKAEGFGTFFTILAVLCGGPALVGGIVESFSYLWQAAG